MSVAGDNRPVVGGSASEADIEKIQTAILRAKEIDRIINMRTVYLDDESFMVGVKISLPATTTMAEVSVIAKLAELRVLEAVPAVDVIYIEPDVWLDPNAPTPTTSAIVTLSID